MVELLDAESCTGCAACANNCPSRCIEMTADEHGFFYPKINHERCIQCRACAQVCKRRLSRKVEDSFPLAYGAYAKDNGLRMDSASGGVFSLLAERTLDSGGVVIGAAMSDDCYHVKHILLTEKKQLGLLRGSKYLQSRTSDIYARAKDHLDNGQKVLFSGTPCQVDGLKAFLNREYDNLTCVDFICHGVPSEMLWEKYCKEVERNTGKKIKRVNFRHKKYSWERLEASITADRAGVKYSSKSEDPYIRLFLGDFGLRPSCYNCQHKGLNRKSDITIADFWGIGKIMPSFSDGKGISLVFVHDRKGEEAISAISDQMIFSETNAAKAIDGNMAGLEAAGQPKLADSFWRDVDAMSIEDLANKYAPIGVKGRIKSRIRKTPIYGELKKCRNAVQMNMEYGILFTMDNGRNG